MADEEEPIDILQDQEAEGVEAGWTAIRTETITRCEAPGGIHKHHGFDAYAGDPTFSMHSPSNASQTSWRFQITLVKPCT